MMYIFASSAVFDRYRGEYDKDWVRVFAVGPASRHTDQGIIGSNQVKVGRIQPIDDWAGAAAWAAGCCSATASPRAYSAATGRTPI